MATETEILQQINTVIVQNGNEEITANRLRPILEALLAFTGDEVGDRADLQTTNKTDLVVALNEVRALITNPADTSLPVVPVFNLVADYSINNVLNKAVHEVQDQGGQPINILIPNDSGNANSTTNPKVGTYYDFFQNTETPVINVGSSVTLKVPEGDTAIFTGVNSGLRLLKVSTNTWRFIRLVRTKTVKKLFGELNVMGREGNNNDVATLEAGDTVYMSNLNDNILLIHGDYMAGDPLEYSSYDPDNSVPFDRDNILN